MEEVSVAIQTIQARASRQKPWRNRLWLVITALGGLEQRPLPATPKYPRHTEATVLLIVRDTTELTEGGGGGGEGGNRTRGVFP